MNLRNLLQKGWLLFAFPVLTAWSHPAPSSPSIVESAYKVLIDSLNAGYVTVQFTGNLTDKAFYVAPGAGQFADGWGHFYRDFEALDSQGNNLEVSKTGPGRWEVAGNAEGPVTLMYKVMLEHGQHDWGGGLDGVAFKTDSGLFFTGRSLFLLNDTQSEGLEVSFKVPQGWQLTTPWQQLPGDGRFLAADQQALTQSMFLAGNHREIPFKRDGFELVFALSGSGVLQKEAHYSRLASGVLDYYIDMMGGLPNPPPDSSLDRAVVLITEAEATDGEVIGSSISISVPANGDPQSEQLATFIFAHEFFHLWNGKTIIPEDDRTEWFKEGFSNFYTLKALRQTGYLDDAAFLGVLNGLFYQRYRGDSGLGTIALVQGSEKHDHWGVIYAGGLMAAIAQDLTIREASGNSRSLDDLMRSMYTRYGGTSDQYSLRELQDRLSALSGVDQQTFFDRYVTGSEPIPVADFFGSTAFNASVEEGNLHFEPKPGPTEMEQVITGGFLGELE